MNRAATLTLPPRIDTLAWSWCVMVSGLSGCLFALPYLQADLYALSWFAFVPWLLVSHRRSFRERYILGMAFGVGCYLTGTYWVVDFLMLFKQYRGAEAVAWGCLFWIYSAQLPALLSVAFAWLQQRLAISDLILFPLLVVLCYAHFPMLFSAQIGESQSHFLVALQGVDRFGVSGLDAVIALVNMLLLRLLLMGKRWLLSLSNWMAVCMVGIWFGYGLWSLQYWQQTIQSWPRLPIGLVQPNEPPAVQRAPVYPGYSRAYPPEMEMTRRLAAAGAELVIWPESAYKGYFDQPAVSEAMQAEVKSMGISLVMQDIEKTDDGAMFNTVALIDSSGREQGRYHKIKRVAFGEYVPGVSDVPLLRARVEAFFGQFLNEIKAGTELVSFKHQAITIVPLICYETMFSTFVADSMAASTNGRLIVAASSNGWFGATRQPFQHLSSAVLRAVENRVAMVHVVNNGPSTVVTPDGHIVLQTDFRQAGGYLAEVPYAPTEERMSQWHPRWFLYVVYIIGSFCLGLALCRRPCAREVLG